MNNALNIAIIWRPLL